MVVRPGFMIDMVMVMWPVVFAVIMVVHGPGPFMGVSMGVLVLVVMAVGV
jgi:hypothetical protein